MVWSLGALGRYDEMNAARVAARRNTHEDESKYLLLDAQAALLAGRRSEALRLQTQIEPYAEAGEVSNAFLGFNYLLLGESDKAAYWLQRAYQRHDVQLVFPEPVDLRLIAEDPRTRFILEQPGLRELFDIRSRHDPTNSP